MHESIGVTAVGYAIDPPDPPRLPDLASGEDQVDVWVAKPFWSREELAAKAEEFLLQVMNGARFDGHVSPAASALLVGLLIQVNYLFGLAFVALPIFVIYWLWIIPDQILRGITHITQEGSFFVHDGECRPFGRLDADELLGVATGFAFQFHEAPSSIMARQPSHWAARAKLIPPHPVLVGLEIGG